MTKIPKQHLTARYPKSKTIKDALLKRNTKPDRAAWFMPVSVGPKFITKSEKLLESMIRTVSKGMYLKNRTSCKFCSFYQTEHCR